MRKPDWKWRPGDRVETFDGTLHGEVKEVKASGLIVVGWDDGGDVGYCHPGDVMPEVKK